MRKYLFLLTMVLACTMHAKTYVVIAGLCDYPGSRMDLWPVKDAQVMRKLYLDNGDSYVITLADSTATLRKVYAGMRQAFSKAGKDDAIVFYFSGHGYRGGFFCYDGTITYEEIVNLMKKSKAKKKMVFADACYAGKARYTNERTDKKYNQQIMFFLSSRTNERSLQLSSMECSFFTKFLEEGLRGEADVDSDKKVSARELFDFVHSHVDDYLHSRVLQSNDSVAQHPVMWGNFRDNMPVMDWSKK